MEGLLGFIRSWSEVDCAMLRGRFSFDGFQSRF